MLIPCSDLRDKIAVADRVVAHPTRPRLARVGASLVGVSMTRAARKFTIRDPKAFAARQRKAANVAAAMRRAGLIPPPSAEACRRAALARHGNRTTEERFWSHVDKSDSGCWQWRELVRGLKYGRFRVGNTIWRAHRFSYQLAFGPIPNGLFVCHRCDNARCVRPDHLFLGTHTDNMRDAQAKGRKYQPGQHSKRGPDGRWQKK